MRLYLARHGEPLPRQVDPERPLSDRGRDDVTRVAKLLADAGVRIPVILHSGKKRAEQTAQLLATHVGHGADLKEASGIDPLDSVPAFAERVSDWTEDTMVVGHLPFMGKLASLLTCGDEEADVATFYAGTVACLQRNDDGWRLSWMINPHLLTGNQNSTK